MPKPTSPKLNFTLGCLFLAFFLFAGAPLGAQLDPRLQKDATDFLNLYQQSATAKAKPEIVTIFDFSASMAPVMYHPLYRNLRPTDDVTYASIEITFLEAANANSITNVKLYLPLTVTLNNSTQLTLTCEGLVKPDGNLVTATDAEKCVDGLTATTGEVIVQKAQSGTYTTAYSSTRPRDIRHWIMAASHIRLKVTGTQGNVSYAMGRTVDVPLPWQVMDNKSTGNPLSSKTIIDKQVKKTFDAQGNSVDDEYGSGQKIEFDLTHKIPPGTSAAIGFHTFGESSIYTASSNSVAFKCYHIPYLHWLFAGRYQSTVEEPKSGLTDSGANNYITGSGSEDNNGAYYVPSSSGLKDKFIVFDSGTDSTKWAAGQTSANWGKGFLGQTITSKIKVPKYNHDETYKGIVDDYVYKYVTPAVTRIQATKVAVIETWIKNQADVYWAYRFLDDKSEYTSNTNKQIDDNDSRKRSTAINQNTLRATANDTASASTVHGASGSSSGDRTTTNRLLGSDSGWVVFNNTPSQGKTATDGNSVRAMKRLAATFHNASTPLTYAMARTLAQYNDPKNVFNDVMGKGDISPCSNSFLILFTDGNDNRGNPTNATPYLNNDGTFDAATGNRLIIGNKASIETTYFNLFTYAALGAHMSNKALGEGNYMDAGKAVHNTTKKDIREYLPFAITERTGLGEAAATVYANPKRVTTMTVGVSLGGRYADTRTAVNPKRSLFFGAVLGDPDITSGTLSDFRPFEPPSFNPDGSLESYNDWELDPINPGWPDMGKRKEGAAYFFDATDADKLTDSLQAAFRAAISKGSNNATSTPNLPYVGASLAGQVYMGSFAVPDGGGALWIGDLRMFGTREVGNTVQIIDKTGFPTNDLSPKKAFWAASYALSDKYEPEASGVKPKKWYSRKLYTRLPYGTDLIDFADRGDVFDNLTNGLQKYVDEKIVGGTVVDGILVGGTVAAKTSEEIEATAKTIQFAAGGDTVKGVYEDAGTRRRPSTNRESIMGDVINSSPATIEYARNVVSGKLPPHLAEIATGNNWQFRLILVGTNQGWLHAFGEVTAKDSRGVVANAHVEELWAFMPTDFLKNLNYITKGGNLHRLMVDGTPSIYHLDVPKNGEGIGNGIVDLMEATNPRSGSNVEPAVAIFGLGKGGRSFYALNIEDPFKPKLQWSLVPDEAYNKDWVAQFPQNRLEAGSGLDAADVSGIISRFGFSTGAPAFGRIIFSNGTNRHLKDAVFVGGGFSTPLVDAVFKDKNGAVTRLGRSVMALDAYDGKVLAAVDLAKVPTHGATVGPVGTGLIPFEFIMNSGAAQRVYFTDYSGGIWAWGSTITNEADGPLKGYRIDTSNLNDGPGIEGWRMRKVAQDSLGSNNARYTTAPAPFLVGNFTGRAKGNSPSPAAVGIAMVSGDRNNPLDFYGDTHGADFGHTFRPTAAHRLTVVFDRQDSGLWKTEIGGDGDGVIKTQNALAHFNTAVNSANGIPCDVQPGCETYYLAPANGSNPKFGYEIPFAFNISNSFIPKGINPPVVVSGSLFYSIFNPTSADPCTGGQGTSQSWVVADVLNPLKEDSNETMLFRSGMIGKEWAGVASDFIQVGTRGVLQGGITGSESLEITSRTASPSQNFPRPRVWRVVR